MLRIEANSRTDSRYDRPTAALIRARTLGLKPRSRPATAKLAARRLTSHSNGPGSVSSKSLTLKTRRRSGAGARVGLHGAWHACAGRLACRLALRRREMPQGLGPGSLPVPRAARRGRPGTGGELGVRHRLLLVRQFE